MSLRRLHETLPAIFLGCDSPRTSFAVYAEEIRNELVRLKRDGIAVRIDDFCPLDFLTLFRPERRSALLNGTAEYQDWRHAAAVRLSSLLAHSGKPRSPESFEQRAAGWKNNPLLRGADGIPAWIRQVFSGEPSDDPDESGLLAPVVWKGIIVRHFLSAGGTSLVYAAECGGRSCVLKVPCPGCETRFLHELAVLRSLHHPNLPEVFAASSGRDPYCVLELCRTGRAAKVSGKVPDVRDALAHLHSAGILHGDIRPANLGIRADGAPVLLDFSHARPAGSACEIESEMEKMRCLLLA
ncbi:MAG: protein kinase family protein [Lentisphaeria bacterium]|nr:protein kinase family protein [Lentisphaeria bacterium]